MASQPLISEETAGHVRKGLCQVADAVLEAAPLVTAGQKNKEVIAALKVLAEQLTGLAELLDAPQQPRPLAVNVDAN